jgi:hypothetical protein
MCARISNMRSDVLDGEVMIGAHKKTIRLTVKGVSNGIGVSGLLCWRSRILTREFKPWYHLKV